MWQTGQEAGGREVEAQDLAQELGRGRDQEEQSPHTAVVEHH